MTITRERERDLERAVEQCDITLPLPLPLRKTEDRGQRTEDGICLMLVVTRQVHGLETLELLDVQRLAHLLVVLEPARASRSVHQVHKEAVGRGG